MPPMIVKNLWDVHHKRAKLHLVFERYLLSGFVLTIVRFDLIIGDHSLKLGFPYCPPAPPM